MKNLKSLFTLLFLALFGLGMAPAYGKNINRIKVPKGFDYATQRTVPVDIQLNLPSSGPGAVSFFARNGKTETLLETDLTDLNGRFQGTITIPAAVRALVISARYQGKIEEATIQIRHKKRIARTLAF